MSISKPIRITSDEIGSLSIQPSGNKIMYVDNERLSAEMAEWSRKIKAAKDAGEERPQMTDYIARSVIQIANNIIKKACYRDYSWASEMIEDGIEDCVKGLHNYDPDAKTRKGKPNAFGYISLIIERAFVHRIEIEKRQDYYKNKSLEMMGADNFAREVGEDGGPSSTQVIDDIIGRVYDYEEKQKAKAERLRDRNKLTQDEPEEVKGSTNSIMNFFGGDE